MSKIGILGGTFNPIHNVHLIMAEEARIQFGLEQILFMPSKNPPHKQKKDIASDEHRKRMIQHALQNHPYFEFSDIEFKRDGITYTKDTLADLKKSRPDDTFYFIVGGDSLAALESWREPEYIFANCHILAAVRDEIDRDKLEQWIHYFEKKYHAVISKIKMPSMSCSSERIREKIQKGESVANYCPLLVENYIRINGLYHFPQKSSPETPDSVMKFSSKEIFHFLEACLKPKRFAHTLSVATTAANLAAVHGADIENAYLAGLLHDCAKYLTGKEMIAECKKADIALSPVEKENTALIHAKLGAYYAKTRYGVTNPEILSAITYHTTGCPNMKLLDKIIYLADYIEPERTTKCEPYSMEQIRKTAFQDLDLALFMVLECSVRYLKESEKPMEPMTMETYQYYKKTERRI